MSIEKMLNRMGFPGQTAKLGTLIKTLRKDVDNVTSRVTVAEGDIVGLDANKMDKSYIPVKPTTGTYSLKCVNGVLQWVAD